ncbi:Protease inhibitor [Lysinibacillus sphaericus]|uniref:Protease inhibitor n=1 Tax=Lysinibacillus sphaericus TaxID=1421 RepID=A0A2S5D0Y1_LYSSH|nr:stalk domain-containing protein [Lysinibacillus sphaericus]POZ56739.1 Protease inhibitor [Lysinibacillus sphaericus]
MKMTKVVPFAMTALLLGGVAIAPTASANEGEAVVTNTQQDEQTPQVQPVFIKVAGTIESVEERNNATYYTTKEGENTNVFVVNKDTLIFDNTGKEVKLQKGDKVTAYTYANKPMLMIYPPQYNPEVIIVETKEMGSVTVDFFNKDLVNTDNSLKLNVGKETVIQSQSAKEVSAKDLAEQHLLVFYTITTRSIPAQTPPTKVIVLDATVKEHGEGTEEVSANAAVQEIIKTDFYEVDGTTMVPLRLIAEELGFKVESTGTGAIVSKGALSYTITRGEKAYGYNKALRYFEVAPALLEPTKTYVPVEFFEELMQ